MDGEIERYLIDNGIKVQVDKLYSKIEHCEVK